MRCCYAHYPETVAAWCYLQVGESRTLTSLSLHLPAELIEAPVMVNAHQGICKDQRLIVIKSVHMVSCKLEGTVVRLSRVSTLSTTVVQINPKA